MKPFTKHTGLVVTMDRANVDTDQIIPKQFLKRIERTGFGEFLFWDWARNPDGSINPDFELHRPEAKGASVLATRRNFGSGSSREHAPWALEDWGFRVIVAPSFADIFYNNCFKNGMLPIVLNEEQVEDLFKRAAAHPGYKLTADLETRTLSDEYGLTHKFEVEGFRRHCLLNGLDDIGLTLEHADKISAYERAHGIAS
jgi:3-isopropylmalate/(R)-2-methylmalate dehydratase small subunit